MKGSLYRERDYALGQTFLTLRITIGLTQADLARHLQVKKSTSGGSCVLQAASGDTVDYGTATSTSILTKNATRTLVGVPNGTSGVWALF